MDLALLITITFLLNIPAGYYRENFKRMSIPWLLILHSPIPLIIFLRHLFGYGGYGKEQLGIIATLVTVAIIAQYIGSRPVRNYILNKRNSESDGDPEPIK